MRRHISFFLVAVLVALSLASSPVAANHDIGPDRVYFPQTGHHLRSGFLYIWRHHGAIPIFGYPLTEEFGYAGGTVQYFERAVFEWHPDAPPGWQVQLRLLGAHAAAGRQHEPPFQRVGPAEQGGGRFFPETSHTINGGFREFWETNGGLRSFGYPLSEEFSEGGRTVQYFERAIFEWHPDAPQGWQVQLRHLGAQAAAHDGVPTGPVAQASGVPGYDPDLWEAPEPPPPPQVVRPPAGAPSDKPKWIEVDLSEQYLRAWAYDSLVLGTYVSTGRAETPTPPGRYTIFYKVPIEDMSGSRASTGEHWYVPDVPNVMYFRAGGYALHGTYWHDNFGTPMSHGCVNLPLAEAEWLYDWAPYGTTVWVHP